MDQKIYWKYGLFVLLIILILRLPSFANTTLYIINTLIIVLAAYFCFQIAKKLYSPRAGLMAALFYAIFTPIYISQFTGINIQTMIITSILPLYFAAKRSLGIIVDLFRSDHKKQFKIWEYLVLIWFLLSLILVILGGKYLNYYILQLYIPLCVLAAGGTVSFFLWLREGKVTRVKQITYSLFILCLLIPPIIFFGAKLMTDKTNFIKYIHGRLTL